MGLRFRQSFKLFPGVRLNLSARGLSASFGIRGASVNVGRRGVRSTVGIPGSGLSFVTNHSSGSRSRRKGPRSKQMWPDNEARSNDDQPQPSPYFQPPAPQEPMREIGSAPVENLTSGGLLELRQVIAEAQTQRAEINGDLKEAQSQHEREIKELERRSRSIFRYFYKRRIALLKGTLSAIAAEIERLSEWRSEERRVGKECRL